MVGEGSLSLSLSMKFKSFAMKNASQVLGDQEFVMAKTSVRL